MKKELAFAVLLTASALLTAGCSAVAAPGSAVSPSAATSTPAAAYFAGTYECAVAATGGNGFIIEDLFIGGSHDYFGGGRLDVGADGSWSTPTDKGTWTLSGSTITISLAEASGKTLTVDVPGFPVTATAATSGTSLVVAHPSYSGGRSVIKASMDGGGFKLTNKDKIALDCARV